ncbi:hypothetical protein Zmor_013149 [Zophobas morio]|uniref:Peptidase M13 C-terminal domain-containing protein n=1 Tax=Zophobas morio TaxID=2755281 RepID=A0AA38IHW1_9CUCU|nr:hypothetical protein Zmor_013149 [Zophobas morio]
MTNITRVLQLELDPFNHFLKINLNVSSFLHKKTVKTFRQRVVKSDWMSQAYCYTANGFFKAKSNSIEIMAALLQYPFFDGDRPYYINFGRIGEVIGHEIIHAFDGEGNQYDEKGNLNSWTPEAVKSFKEKSECFVGQYGNMTIPESGMAVDGVKTLNENIADNGGFKIAYRGYLKWVKQNGEELLLPGLSYSPRQMFWISVATNGCAKYRKEALGKFVSTNVHALEYFRVMVPFMNLEDFSRDFNCSTGSVMNPEDKCEVW